MMFTQPDAAFAPKIAPMDASFSSRESPCILTCSCLIMFDIFSMGGAFSSMLIPSLCISAWASIAIAVASDTLMPKASISLDAFFGGPDRRKRPIRKAVPAIEPFMPALPIIMVIAAVSSSDAPKAAATGAAYFMVSPRDSRLTLALVRA